MVALAALCCVTVSIAWQPEPMPVTAAQEIKIVGWNLENLFDSFKDQRTPTETIYTPEQVQEKIAKDAEVLRFLNADIVGLCEVENLSILRVLCDENLKDLGYKYQMLIDDKDPRGIDVGIISRRPFTAQNFSVPGFYRGILGARFTIAGEPFWVLVNHWKSRGGGGEDQRLACAERVLALIREELPRYEGRPVPCVIIGDLNDEASDLSVKKLTDNGLVDTLAGLSKEDRWTLPYLPRGAAEPLYQGFDHCLITPNLRDGLGVEWIEGSSRVVKPPFMIRKRPVGGREFDWPADDYRRGDEEIIGYADHLPVVTRIRFVDPEAPLRTIASPAPAAASPAAETAATPAPTAETAPAAPTKSE